MDHIRAHGLQPKRLSCAICFSIRRKKIRVIILLLSCESDGIFLRYFKDILNGSIESRFIDKLPERFPLHLVFLVNPISSSFAEMVLFWIKGEMQHSLLERAYGFKPVPPPPRFNAYTPAKSAFRLYNAGKRFFPNKVSLISAPFGYGISAVGLSASFC